MYKYKIKGKEQTFDTSKLDEKDKLKWDKLGKIGKLRMIESYNLTDSSGVPGDYIDIKVTKDKPQNERLAKLRIEEQKKNELDKIKKDNNLDNTTKISDMVENNMTDEQKTLFKEDTTKITNSNPNATLGDLMNIYVDKIEQLTANDIGTINAKNIDTINATSVNKLMFDVKKLTDDLVNPLRPVLENLIERHGNDRRVLELADRNDIQGLMNELRNLNDTQTINEIQQRLGILQDSVNALVNVPADLQTIQNIANQNSADITNALNQMRNEFNPIKLSDIYDRLQRMDIRGTENMARIQNVIERILNEKLTKADIRDLLNEEANIDELRNELNNTLQDIYDKINDTGKINTIKGIVQQLLNTELTNDDIKELKTNQELFNGLRDEILDGFDTRVRALINEVDKTPNEVKLSNESLDEIKNILKTNPEHKDITTDEIKKMFETNKEELSKQFDESFNKTFDAFKKEILKSPKLSEDKNDILKGIFNDLVNKYPNEFVNIAKGELSDYKFKDILNQTYNRMKRTLIDSLANLKQNINADCVIGISDGDTREGYTKYKPYILFNDNWEKDLIDAINAGYNLRLLPSNKEVSSSQIRSKYNGYDDLIEMLQDFVILNPSVKTVSGSIFSKIKDRITNKKGYDDLKDEVNNLKSEVNKLKQELETIKKAKAPEPPKAPEIPKAPEPPKNNFLNDIIKRKDLKHVEQIKNDYTPDEGIVGDLKDIMKRRREDIEPDEYSEDEDIDWAAGIRKPKIMSYKDFLKVYNLY